MAKILTTMEIEEIQGLIDKKYTQPQIARMTGRSTGTISNVARKLISVDRNKKPQVGDCVEDVELLWRPYSKCSTCGYNVQKPCLYCCLKSGDIKSLKPILMEEEV